MRPETYNSPRRAADFGRTATNSQGHLDEWVRTVCSYPWVLPTIRWANPLVESPNSHSVAELAMRWDRPELLHSSKNRSAKHKYRVDWARESAD